MSQTAVHNLSNKQKSIPIVDGHYWIVRDGKIIDPYFMEYNLIKMINGLTDDIVYIDAPQLIQSVLIKKMQPIEEIVSEMPMNTCAEFSPRFNYCIQNALIERKLRGGKLVFGSVGWKKRDGKGVHYEFGGLDWTVRQFLKM